MCYKILHDLVDFDFEFFKRSMYSFTCGNTFNFAKLPVVSERDNVFTNRVINM